MCIDCVYLRKVAVFHCIKLGVQPGQGEINRVGLSQWPKIIHAAGCDAHVIAL